MPIHIDTKYINLLSPRLDRFQWKKQSLAVCRCPMCGDSQKSKSKARFYLYEKKGSFSCKCHNCDYSATLSWLLKTLDPNLYKQYTFEVLKETGVSHGRTHAHADAPAHAPVRREDKILSLLPRLDSLPNDHPAVMWATKRRLPKESLSRLYYSENYGEWAKNIDPDVQAGDDERIVIPILDTDGKVVGAQGRIIGSSKPDRSTIRYLTVKADKDAGKTWYGLDRCDPKKQVIVVEGPLDSLFLDNCVAMVGLSDATNIPEELKDSDLIYALDNEPRNKQVGEAMERLLEDGHKVCVWSEKFRGLKDINDMVLAGNGRTNIQYDIIRNSFSGLAGHIALKRWAK
jgi:hypothetical protein